MKFMSSRHCEKTSYFLAFSLIAFLYFTFLIGSNRYTYPEEYFYLTVFGTVGGYLGVLYYKISKHKPLKAKTLIMFWKDH